MKMKFNMTVTQMVHELEKTVKKNSMTKSEQLRIQAIIDHLTRPANNAELVERLKELKKRGFADPFFIDEIIAALSAAPEVEAENILTEQLRLSTESINELLVANKELRGELEFSEVKLQLDRQNRQPANPSALADDIDGLADNFDGDYVRVGERCLSVDLIKDTLNKAAQALRKFDVLQCLRDGGHVNDNAGNLWKWRQHGPCYFISEKAEWRDPTNQITDGFFRELFNGTLKPYTADEVLEPDSGLYNVTWADGDESVCAVGISPNGGRWIACTNWTCSGVFSPEAVKTMWKIEQPKGGAS